MEEKSKMDSILNFRKGNPSDLFNSQNEKGMQSEEQPTDHTELHRGLKARHITMIAIGGAIGTGLIIGTLVLSHPFFFFCLFLGKGWRMC